VGNRSIRRYRWRAAGRRPSRTRRAFLADHALPIWAADRLTVQTLPFRTWHVLRFIRHGRRHLAHLGVTAHPTAAWVRRRPPRRTTGRS
jgi:hypothetical protein